MLGGKDLRRARLGRPRSAPNRLRQYQSCGISLKRISMRTGPAMPQPFGVSNAADSAQIDWVMVSAGWTRD
jgi:hypothetical protein